MMMMLLSQSMKALETRETRGFFFLVSDDLKAAATLKAEAARRSVCTILRHCHRMREIRGPPAVVRFAVPSAAQSLFA